MTRRYEAAPEPGPSSPDAEAALVARIAAGDQQAFAEFYALYRRRLGRFLGRFLDSADTVDELINDTLFVVWREAARYESRSRVSTWVFGIAWHKALRALERQKRSATRWPLVAESQPDVAPVDLDQRDWLRRGLDALSPEHRLVVELTFYAGCSYEEIAAIARCPVNTVKTRMFYARQKLRDLLQSLDAARPGDRP